MVKTTLNTDQLLGFRLVGSDAGTIGSPDKIADKIGDKIGAKVPKDPDPTTVGSFGADIIV